MKLDSPGTAARRRIARTVRLTALATLVAGLSAGGAEAQAASESSVPAIGTTAFVGAGIYEIAVSPSTGIVYAAAIGQGQGNAKIYGLDPETLETVSTIDVSEAPAFGLGLNDRTQTLYTTNTRVGSASAIDLRSGSVRTIETPLDPGAHLREVVVDEEANTIYMSSFGEDGAIWVIDGATNEIVAVVRGVGDGSSGMALDRAANALYVTNLNSNDISVLDLSSRQVVRRFSAGGDRPTNAAFDPATNRLFVANQNSADLTVLDVRTGELLKSIPTGAGALGVTFNSGNGLVYVANRMAGTVTVVDGASLEVVTTLGVGSRPNTIAVNPSTNVAYVTKKPISGGRGGPPVADPNGDTVTRLAP